MKVCELGSSELRPRLHTAELFLRTGPFTAAIHSPFPEVAAAIELLYADFPVVVDDAYADFHLRLTPAPRLRDRLRGRCICDVGGYHQFDPFPRAMLVPYLEWGLNWCAANHAHQHLILHAATLARGDRALILLGPSGAGKSTLCTALALGGWRLLSDEMAIISPQTLQLTALARPVSLKNESIPLIRQLAPQAQFTSVTQGERKGAVVHMRPEPSWVDQVAEPATPAWLLFVRHQADAPTELREVSNARGFMRAAQCAFNYSLLGQRGFETMAEVVDRCKLRYLRYSQLDDALPLLEQQLFNSPQQASL